MAFTTVIDGTTVFGNKRIVYGHSASTLGDTGGTIVTGLSQVHNFQATAQGGAIVADAPTVNATLPLATSGSIPVITTATTLFTWIAIGV